MLFIVRVDALLGKKRNVAKAIGRTIGTIEKRRKINDDLCMLFWNQFQPLAVSIVPNRKGLWVVLMHKVSSELLLQSRRHSNQRGYPVRLFSLCGADSSLI